jgi:2-methylcitrate dehydratase PrpD
MRAEASGAPAVRGAATAASGTEQDRFAGYRAALLDWMACAVRGRSEPAARAAAAAGEGLLERVAALGAAGHVLDFDDTYLPGIAHLSAPVAPAAIVAGAHAGASVGDVLGAYARGFEAMGALSAAGHPALYDRGWHPTAVCGGVGAAVATAALLGAPEDVAAALAALRAGGLRAAFGSDGKSLQVGLAAASGVAAAQLAAAGASVPRDPVAAAWRDAYGGAWAEPGEGPRAVERNWIKAWPCCLQTHGAIECAERVREAGGPPPAPLVVLAHPVSRQAAAYDEVETPLQAKFSIPYTTAYTLLRGAPRVDAFDALDDEARELARGVAVRTSTALGESEFALLAGDEELARVDAARGSPEHPLTPVALRAKVHDLAGDRLDGALDDPADPAAALLERLG